MKFNEREILLAKQKNKVLSLKLLELHLVNHD